MNRSSGFYWVLLIDGKWTVAEWINREFSANHWVLLGMSDRFQDGIFEKIDERPLFYDHKMDR